MSLATLLPNLRAAFRARLLTAVDIDVTVAVTVAGGVFTRASGSWIADGFAIGQELKVSGAAIGTMLVKGIEEAKLVTTSAAGGSGAARFIVGLPSAVAWEGAKFAPKGSPFAVEKVQMAGSTRRSFGPNGLIQHRALMHCNLFYPAQGATLAIERMTGALMQHFRPGTDLIHGGDAARVEQVEASPLMLDNEWLSQAVTVTALAFTSD